MAPASWKSRYQYGHRRAEGTRLGHARGVSHVRTQSTSDNTTVDVMDAVRGVALPSAAGNFSNRWSR